MPINKKYMEKAIKEFREKFSKWNNTILGGELESFLTDQLSKQKEEIKKRISLMKIYDIDDTSRSVINMHWYNDAIRDIINLLNQ
jgi:hypothetical protein